MKAVLGKDKKPKKGDVVQFGIYDDQPIKWHVLETDARSHKALLIADSYCGKAEVSMRAEYLKCFRKECFSPDEQKLIEKIEFITRELINKYLTTREKRVFYPYGKDKEPVKYLYEENGECFLVGTRGGIPNEAESRYTHIRPILLVKYDCVPAEEDAGEEQKQK